eukprot:2887670-Prymnesium_polylepis.1
MRRATPNRAAGVFQCSTARLCFALYLFCAAAWSRSRCTSRPVRQPGTRHWLIADAILCSGSARPSWMASAIGA